jgi:D-tyrosyl-tRNA(Tyr) deacylase
LLNVKAVVQRVKSAQVAIEGRIVGRIKKGLLVLLGIKPDDTERDVKFLAEKIINLRIFSDEQDKMNLSLLDIKGEILIVSQFTLYGDCSKGRRPSFAKAALPEIAEKLYEQFIQEIKKSGLTTQTGQFGAMMDVELVNDGPVTLILET